MKDTLNESKNSVGRRSFLKKGLAVGAAGVGLLADRSLLFAQNEGAEEGGGTLTQGDAAMLRFAAAAASRRARLDGTLASLRRNRRQKQIDLSAR